MSMGRISAIKRLGIQERTRVISLLSGLALACTFPFGFAAHRPDSRMDTYRRLARRRTETPEKA